MGKAKGKKRSSGLEKKGFSSKQRWPSRQTWLLRAGAVLLAVLITVVVASCSASSYPKNKDKEENKSLFKIGNNSSYAINKGSSNEMQEKYGKNKQGNSRKNISKNAYGNSQNISIVSHNSEKEEGYKEGYKESHKNKKGYNSSNNSYYIPKQGISWHWQLTGKISLNRSAELYNIDLIETKKETIDGLHAKGKKVICYFSAGTIESFRNGTKGIPKEAIGRQLEDWPDERWLDISRYSLFSETIKRRLDLAVEKGCDGVEPDNIDAYENDNGFNIGYNDQLKFNKWLAKEAHKRGLSIALKNNLGQAEELADYFDFAINEECFYYDECGLLLPFIRKGKAVLGVEYSLLPSEFCKKAKEMNFSWLKASYELNGNIISCDSYLRQGKKQD